MNPRTTPSLDPRSRSPKVPSPTSFAEGPNRTAGVQFFDSSRIDPVSECTYKALTADESRKYCPVHCHDYFELFLVTDGELVHVINGGTEKLTSGHCVFIRPDDEHRFEPVTGSIGRFTNIEIARTTIDAVREFLGPALEYDGLIASAMPPKIRLDAMERERLDSRLRELNRLPVSDGERIRLRLRALLADLLGRYFGPDEADGKSGVPRWLQTLCYRMGYQPNVAAGVSRMVEISNKSPAYLSRAFRKYFGQTPSEYVRHARLTFAANLLAHTEYKIGWIAKESGFPNVSNFYNQFYRVFKVTPAEFRRKSQGVGMQGDPGTSRD